MLSSLFVFSPGAAVLALMAGAASAAAVLFSEGYFDDRGDRRRFRALTLLFFLSVCGALFSADWLGYLIFLEVSTLALFFLIARKESATAFRYLVVQLAGAAVVLTAVAGTGAGTLPIGPVSGGMGVLLIAGLGVKAALPGLHFWLPEVHGKAPAPVSALLSGVAVKVGVFGIAAALGLRTSNILLAAGTAMALWGVVQALLQYDMKRLLAYHTISQLGYIIAAAGTGSDLGTAAAFYHSAAHGLFKGALFLCAGALEKTYGTRDLARLGGAAKRLPAVFCLFLVSAAAIAGLPGTMGYGSKILVKQAVNGFPLVSLGLLAANAGTVMSFTKMGWYAFSGPEKTLPRIPSSRSVLMSAGIAVPVLFVVFFGIFPGVVPEVLGQPGTGYFSSGKITEGILLLAAGVGCFVLLKEKIASAKSIPDLDVLVDRAAGAFGRILPAIGRLQGGLLREYVLITAGAAICLLFVLF